MAEQEKCPHCGLNKATRFGGFGCARRYGEPFSHACEVRVRDKRIAVLRKALAAAEEMRRYVEGTDRAEEKSAAFDAAMTEVRKLNEGGSER